MEVEFAAPCRHLVVLGLPYGQIRKQVSVQKCVGLLEEVQHRHGMHLVVRLGSLSQLDY